MRNIKLLTLLDEKMENRRNFTKKALAFPLISNTLPKVWLAPTLTAITLPVHAQTSNLAPTGSDITITDRDNRVTAIIDLKPFLSDPEDDPLTVEVTDIGVLRTTDTDTGNVVTLNATVNPFTLTIDFVATATTEWTADVFIDYTVSDGVNISGPYRITLLAIGQE